MVTAMQAARLGTLVNSFQERSAFRVDLCEPSTSVFLRLASLMADCYTRQGKVWVFVGKILLIRLLYTSDIFCRRLGTQRNG